LMNRRSVAVRHLMDMRCPAPMNRRPKGAHLVRFIALNDTKQFADLNCRGLPNAAPRRI
jgi:hypothetical protein